MSPPTQQYSRTRRNKVLLQQKTTQVTKMKNRSASLSHLRKLSLLPNFTLGANLSSILNKIWMLKKRIKPL